MPITAAAAFELEPAVDCLGEAFAQDPITGFLLQSGPGYPARVRQFFALLMGARVALGMPVLVARSEAGIQGAAMGYTTARPAWPQAFAEDWDHFEAAIPGLSERMARYDEIAERCKPPVPHHYLGVIGVHPGSQGRGLGLQLLQAFCEQAAADPLSSGVYLETANPANVPFYQRAGFVETGRGTLGSGTLWCMFLRHAAR
jgi:ribosomal protein S18 acetylase RimI-like enzyme